MEDTSVSIRHSSGEWSGNSVAEQIEQSKTHWSILADSDSNEEDEEVAEVSNVEVFEALQSHPTWGSFFYKFNQGDGSTLQVGEKFAEGGQAELFHAQVTWWSPMLNEWHLEHESVWALKVFKKGTFLRHLQHQLPHGLLHYYAEEIERWKSPVPPKRKQKYSSSVLNGTLLEDGRFAFIMQKEYGDLRQLIERNMKLTTGGDCVPFSKEEAEHTMFKVAQGLDWLHSYDIVHRDVKASNVLIQVDLSDHPRKWICFIADYECSVGVVGTGFFRAPEILQALKDGKLRQRPEVFSKAADVYSYGMTCYEILTGKLPFEGHPQTDYDFVINGQRPMVPAYVEEWTRELLRRCWQSDPVSRPSIGEILNLVLANSAIAKDSYEFNTSVYGENMRTGRHRHTSM